MNKANSINIESVLELSSKIHSEYGLKSTLLAAYWRAMLSFTSILEKTGYPRTVKANSDVPIVLNFGCGNHYVDALNSDLFSPHRYLKRRKRPDLYLSGLNLPNRMAESVDAIICEHVLEHMLPHQADAVLRNLWGMLKAGGRIQISVPSLDRLVDCTAKPISLDAMLVNDMIYRYGHQFMHNGSSICGLLTNAGFRNASLNSYFESPFRHLLAAEREPQSIYVIAEK